MRTSLTGDTLHSSASGGVSEMLWQRKNTPLWSFHNWTQDGLAALWDKTSLPHTAQHQSNGQNCQCPKRQVCTRVNSNLVPFSGHPHQSTAHTQGHPSEQACQALCTSAQCPERRNGKSRSHILICPNCSWRHLRKSNLKMGPALMKKGLIFWFLHKNYILNNVIFFHEKLNGKGKFAEF